MNNFTIEGRLISKGELETFPNSKKRSFIIEVEDKSYKEQPEFVLWGEKAENFNVSLGSLVEVSFGLVGRTINKRDGGTFQKTELKAWKVVVSAAGESQQTYAPKTYPKGKEDATISDPKLLEEDNPYAHKDDFSEDLPF